MINFIIKNFRIFIDSIILIAVIVAFSLWDPFSWFRSETKIKDTPVSLRSIKEIGQLVTAEYYGEVVASLKESMIEDYSEDTIKIDVHELFSNILASVEILKKEDQDNKSKWINLKGSIKQSNITRKFENHFQSYTEHYLYFPLINFLADTLPRSKEVNTTSDREEQILWYLYSADQKMLDVFGKISEKNPGYLSHFSYHYRGYRVDSLKKEKVKKEIIYIGRGWVKAGIDFQDFNETKFWYDQKSKVIYFRKFEPKILDCDINPWYIPERQIKGFELVVATGKIKKPFEDSRKVKILCKEKLRKQALQSGILEQARTNARLSIQRLFSLLMDETVKDVVFPSGKYQLLLQEIKADSVINESESQLIDTLLRYDTRIPDTAWYTNLKIQVNDLKDFCDDLKKLKFELTGQHFSYFSPALSGIYKDGILKNDDMKKLSETNEVFLRNKDIFEMKTKLLKLYCDLSPDFKQVYDFLSKNDTARNYLQLSPDLFSVKNKTQYLLTSQGKKEFLRIVDDKLNSIFTKDPDFEALFWFEKVEKYQATLNEFNLQVFDFAAFCEITPEAPWFVPPDNDPSLKTQLQSILDRKGIKLHFR